MQVVRINAQADLPRLNASPQPIGPVLRRACTQNGPVVVMIHGYKYSPALPARCPHRSLFNLQTGWPAMLARGKPAAALCIAFGWHARGTLWAAHRNARAAGRALAHALSHIPSGCPIHIIAHSLGSEVALHALHHMPAGSAGRVVLLTGASYQSRALSALQTPAGRIAQLINVTTRQNVAFDLMFQALVAPDMRRDRPLGRGLTADNAINLTLDCPKIRQHLAASGLSLPPCPRPVSHWSVYTRPGAMALYQALMLGDLPQQLICRPATAPRRLRLPMLPLPRREKV